MDMTQSVMVCMCLCLLVCAVQMAVITYLLFASRPQRRVSKEQRAYIQAREIAMTERMQAGTVGNDVKEER